MEETEFMNVSKRKNMPHTLVLEHVSPATRLLEKRRQMFEVQEALEAQKREFNRKEEVFKRREEGLKKKDLELQESLIRFSKFLQENDSKRSRAEKKAADEIKLRLQKQQEIERLNEQLDTLREEKSRTSGTVERGMRYQKYLETVLDSADEYHEIGDLLMRHATLEATNTDLREHAGDCMRATEETRGELQAYTKMRTDEVLSLNNEVSVLKKDAERQERISLGLESKKDYALQTAGQKTLEHGQVGMSTDNLFHRCQSRSKVSHPNYSDPLNQLTVIGDFMADLGAIVKSWRASDKSGRGPRAGDESKPPKTSASMQS